MKDFLDEQTKVIKEKVGNNPVLLLISGGVDSTVVSALLLKILKKDQIHLMYMDTGLMRKNETEFVRANLEKLGAENIHVIMCEGDFLSALKGVTDPEEKRRIIGDMYITIQEREAARLKADPRTRLHDDYFLVQGSIRPDFLESGQKTGNINTDDQTGNNGVKKTSIVKSHHNVASPLVIAKRAAGRIIEPLAALYKDEVRELGRFLGVDEAVVNRHPFPGPGLAVRIIGEVTKEKCDILREADAVFIDKLKKRKSAVCGKSLYDDIWQAFTVLLPVRSVGVAGDVRKYGYVLALRAINSRDGMTAEVYPFETPDLLEISARITNSVKEIGRVTYDITGKPPATIEWE